MKKPAIRWTIGPFSKTSFNVLKLSIRNIRKIYRDQFHLTVTYNNVNSEDIERLDIDSAINQCVISHNMPLQPPEIKQAGPAWKLYPARTSLETHEIMLDNDVVIIKKMEAIDRFLSSDSLFLITESLQRSYSVRYDSKIRKEFNVNSGFVALPPFFDYVSEISKNTSQAIWTDMFDEQSIVACVLQSHDVEVIPKEHISVIGSTTEYQLGKYGVHFIGINSGFDEHWLKFTSTRSLL